MSKANPEREQIMDLPKRTYLGLKASLAKGVSG